jgi:hypothetical protein
MIWVVVEATRGDRGGAHEIVYARLLIDSQG